MSTPLRVLIVEDEEADALLMVLELEKGGYELQYERVETAEVMAAALAAQTWDVVISDYSLPHFNGIQALHLVKERGLDLPFILVSGKIGEETAVAAMKAGAHDYVMKDRLARLAPVVQREIKEAQMRREYRQAENALRCSEEKYRSICENAVEGIFQSTPEGRFLSINSAIAEMMGFDSTEEMLSEVTDIGQYWVNPGRREEFNQQIDEYGIVRSFEAQIRRRDGKNIWISLNARGACDLEKKSLHYEGFVENISHRKEAEEGLRRANRALKTLSACNHALAYATDKDAFQKEICRILQEVAGYRLSRICRIKPGETMQGKLPASTEPGKSEAGCSEIIVLPLAVAGQPCRALVVGAEKAHVFDCDEIKLLEEYAMDVSYGLNSLQAESDRQKAEIALRESEECYRSLVESSPDAIGQMDLELDISMANQQAEEMLRYERLQELMGKSFLEIIDPRDHDRARQNMQKVLETGVMRNVELTFCRKDGTTFFGEFNAAVIRNGQGKPLGFTGAIRDISARKKAEIALEQSIKKLQRMLNGITNSFATAVEIRDPYTAGHQKRVALLARAIAEEMQLPHVFVEGIEVMALLHDIGKIAIPAEILSKTGRLTEVEYELIRKHPHKGCEILSEIEFPWPVTEGILQHHERLDGSGYPFKLKGDEIILEARILAVADVVEAMASHRPYRPALGLDKALEEISQRSGILYDQEVVQSCLHLFAGKKFYWCRDRHHLSI